MNKPTSIPPANTTPRPRIFYGEPRRLTPAELKARSKRPHAEHECGGRGISIEGENEGRN